MSLKDQLIVLLGIVLSALFSLMGFAAFVYAGYLLAEWIRL